MTREGYAALTKYAFGTKGSLTKPAIALVSSDGIGFSDHSPCVNMRSLFLGFCGAGVGTLLFLDKRPFCSNFS